MKTDSSKSVIIALTANIIVAILKFIGYLLTQSSVFFAESLHTFGDAITQLCLLFGIKFSSLTATQKHPFGRGSSMYLFNFLSSILVFFIGCGFSVYHSVHSLMNPSSPIGGYIFLVAISILLASLIIEGYSLVVVIKEINLNRKKLGFLEFVFKGSNPTLSAVFLEDSIAVLGVVLAIIGQSLSFAFKTDLPDSIFGLVIGIMLGFMALFLGYVNAQLLLGKSAGIDKEAEIKEYLESFQLIEKVCDLKTEVLKPNAIAVIAEVEFNGAGIFSLEQIENQLDRDCVEVQELMLDNVDDKEKLKRILVKLYSRSNRIFGKQIDDIQDKVKKEFPDVVLITLEIK